MRQNCTNQFNEIIKKAEEISVVSRNSIIGTEHLLTAFMYVDCRASARLREMGVTIDKLRISSDGKAQSVSYSERAVKAINCAIHYAEKSNCFASAEHLLIALIEDNDGYARRLLESASIDVKRLLSILYTDCGLRTGGAQRVYAGVKKNESIDSLRQFGTDLTEKASAGKLDPVIGRHEEIERVIQILSRRTKNNPVLIGEPGVGKSAVVEGLAQMIIDGSAPENLIGKTIFSLDIAGMLAGTKYRGDFEERLKNAIDTILANKNIILFIDEIHNIVGAGSSGEGKMDAAEILKPLLARGEMQTIGATTIEEYRKFIEKDSALERRFQPVTVSQPSVPDTIKILYGLREKYEEHHKVVIEDSAVEAAVKLSDRYITDRFLPDKAIDLIDETCSRAYLNGLSLGNRNMRISWDDIAETVSRQTSVPVMRISENEGQKLLNLEKLLHERVIGQDEAAGAVARSIRRNRAGLKDPDRPIGSFIFVGPTGVGKTELARALASALFGDENLIIRLDMSEYMEKHSTSKMIGAPPGYAGYEDAAGLTDKVKRKPYSVILFDEIEKAHADVFNLLLQILDDGRLTDQKGRTVSFKNTIIIMTSNLGVNEIRKPKQGEDVNYDDMKERLLMSMKRYFKPEFLNRLDDIIVFHHLSREHNVKIAEILLTKLSKRLSENNTGILFTRKAVLCLADKGYDSDYGARPLKRVIQREVEDKLSEAILMGAIKPGDEIIVDCREDKIVFEKR